MSRLDVTSLVAGVALAVLGFLLMLEERGEVELGFAYTGPALIVGLGAVLLASGLAARRRR